MKYQLVFFIQLLFILPSYSQNEKSKVNFDEFQYFKNSDELIAKNKVKSEIIYEYFTTNNFIDSSIVTSVLYNNSGELFKYNTFKNNLLQNTVDIFIDTLSNSKIITNNYVKENKITSSSKWNKTFDSTEKHLKEVSYDQNIGDSIISETYFSKKNFPDSIFVTIKNNNRFLLIKYNYNNEKLVQSDHYSSIGTLTFSIFHTYSNDYLEEKVELIKLGNHYPISTKNYNTKGELIKTTNYLTDKNGNLDNKKWNKKGLKSVTEFTYSPNGLLKERKLTSSKNQTLLEKRFYY